MFRVTVFCYNFPMMKANDKTSSIKFEHIQDFDYNNEFEEPIVETGKATIESKYEDTLYEITIDY